MSIKWPKASENDFQNFISVTEYKMGLFRPKLVIISRIFYLPSLHGN